MAFFLVEVTGVSSRFAARYVINMVPILSNINVDRTSFYENDVWKIII